MAYILFQLSETFSSTLSIFTLIFFVSLFLNVVRLKLNPDQGGMSIKKQLFATGFWRALCLIILLTWLISMVMLALGCVIFLFMLATKGNVDWRSIFMPSEYAGLGFLVVCAIGVFVLTNAVASRFNFSFGLIATTDMGPFRALKESWRLTKGRFLKMQGLNLIIWTVIGIEIGLMAVIIVSFETLFNGYSFASMLTVMSSSIALVILAGFLALPYAHAYKLRLEDRF
ncbi:MAG: hypothetical protein ACK5O7_03910 [Holosporales bacterium]